MEAISTAYSQNISGHTKTESQRANFSTMLRLDHTGLPLSLVAMWVLTINSFYYHSILVFLTAPLCFLQAIQTVLKSSASNIIFFNGLRDPWSGGGYNMPSLLFNYTIISIMLKPHYLLQGVKEYIKINSCSCWKKRLVITKLNYIICVLLPFSVFIFTFCEQELIM